MAERPSFGRRNTHSAPGGAAPRSTRSDAVSDTAGISSFAPGKSPQARTAIQVTSHLGNASQAILLVGELLAFSGLVLAFVAVMLWPVDPHDLKALGGKIYIPGFIAENLAFADPQPRETFVEVTLKPIDLTNLVVPLIWLTGLVAIIRKRWILAGLTSGFFLLPWSLFGYEFSLGAFFWTPYALVAGFHYLRLSKRTVLLLIPVIMLVVPLIWSFANSIFLTVWMPTSTASKVEYRTVKFADLVANETPAKEIATNGGGIGRISTLAGIETTGPAQDAAKAYVLAQEHAFRDQSVEAGKALQVARSGLFKPNRFDELRLNAIERYVAAEGTYGAVRQEAVISEYRTKRIIAWLVAGIGILIGLAGPFSDVVSTGMRQRADRIGKMLSNLAEQRGNLKRPDGSNSAMQSAAAADGESIVNSISRRTRFYGIFAGTFAALSLACLYDSYRFFLPNAESNTAFADVALASGALDFASAAGLVSPSFAPPNLLWSSLQAFGLFGLVPLVVLLLTRNLRPFLVAMLVSGVVEFATSGAALLRPNYAIPTESLGADARNALLESAKGKAELAMPPTATGLPPVDSSTAAYTLAQLAYIENRPADAGHFFELITDPSALSGVVHHQRAAIMTDWVVAKGQHPSIRAWTPDTPRPINYTRQLGKSFLHLSLLFAGLAVLSFSLLFVANKRRSRIRALVDERRDAELMIGKML